MRRFLIPFLLALGAAAPAFAVTYEYSTGGSEKWFPSANASCQQFAVDYTASRQATDNVPYEWIFRDATETACGLHGQYKNGGGWIGDSGFPIAKREAVVVVPENKCGGLSGVTQTVNWTVGYSRSATEYTLVGPASYPGAGNVCVNGCNAAAGDAVAAWRSKASTDTGLYRMSIDYKMTYAGSACNGDAAPTNPTDTIPPCVGSLGTVNGKPYCAGTATSPVSADQPVAAPVPPSDGNPAAGVVPASGPGSGVGGEGRTPVAGDGGPRGGPAGSQGNAANGVEGTGNTGTVTNGTITKPADGKEQANCGAPGQPQCKIDETGTPTDAAGKLKAGTDQMNAGMDGHKKLIDDLKENTGPSWSLTFELPSSCTPFELWEGMSVDMCKYQPVIHDLMSMIWIATTLWACIAMMGRTFNSGT
jgi:hypothetical protein